MSRAAAGGRSQKILGKGASLEVFVQQQVNGMGAALRADHVNESQGAAGSMCAACCADERRSQCVARVKRQRSRGLPGWQPSVQAGKGTVALGRREQAQWGRLFRALTRVQEVVAGSA